MEGKGLARGFTGFGGEYQSTKYVKVKLSPKTEEGAHARRDACQSLSRYAPSLVSSRGALLALCA